MTENDRYLWDRTGPVDEEVERLERLLAPLAHPEGAAPPSLRPSPLVAWIPFAAAASLLAAGLAAWTGSGAGRPPETSPEGVIPAGASVVADGAPVPAGQWIQATDAPREVVLGHSGSLTLDRGSRLQVRHLAADETRLFLERGSLEARIGAGVKPRFFQVDTNAARCVDLGCRYTLSVDAAGVSRVVVLTGQVSFETETREVYVPRGATCVARTGSGPGTPRFENAPAALSEAADAFDAASPAARSAASARVLAEVKTPRDTLVAWHLLEDADPEIARAAETALVAVAARPEGLSEHAGPPTAQDRERWKAHLESSWW